MLTHLRIHAHVSVVVSLGADAEPLRHGAWPISLCRERATPTIIDGLLYAAAAAAGASSWGSTFPSCFSLGRERQTAEAAAFQTAG
jgi:hypothetical protein